MSEYSNALCRSRRGPVSIVPQAAQPLLALDWSIISRILSADQLVFQFLMAPLFRIVGDIVGNGSIKRLLSHEDHPIEEFALDRLDKPFA